MRTAKPCEIRTAKLQRKGSPPTPHGFPVVVTDVDGTLLDRRGELSRAACSAIQSFMGQGGQIILATGKSLAAIEHIVRRFELRLPQIVIDGAALALPETRQVVPRAWLNEKAALKISRHLEQQRVPYVAYTASSILATASGIGPSELHELQALSEPDARLLPSIEELLAVSQHVLKILAFAESRLDAPIAAFHRGQVPRTRLVRTTDRFLEFSSLRSGKLRALRQLATACGFSLRDVAAIGDGDNDAELIAAVGLGAAVANATSLAKSGAHRVLLKSHSEGFALFLRGIKVEGIR